MKRFYRYIIYKLYSYGLKKNNDTPIANVIITLAFVHFIQLFILYNILLIFFPLIDIYLKIDKIYVGIFFLLFMGSHYFIFYNKVRWQYYLEEFKNETDAEKRRGWWFVRIYLIGSILLFFILIPVLFR